MNTKRKKIGVSITVALTMLLFLAACTSYRSPDYKTNSEDFTAWGKELRDNSGLELAILPFTNKEKEVEPESLFTCGPVGKFFSGGEVKEFDSHYERYFVNQVTKEIWKKNEIKLAKKKDIINAIQKADMPIENIHPPLNGNSTNKQKLQQIGKELDVDYLIVGASRENIEAPKDACASGGCTQGCMTLLSNKMTSRRRLKLGMQMGVFDVQKGDFKVLHANRIAGELKANASFHSSKHQEYVKSFLVDIPLPSEEELRKRRNADIVSGAATIAANILLQGAGVDDLMVSFNFDWQKVDETWKTYPEGYFMANYGYEDSDYAKL